MRLQKKSYSRLCLTDMLRRRRSNLTKFLTENGIVTYELLCSRCASMGVLPPSEEEFKLTRGVVPEVSSPTEGVVVVEVLPSRKTEEVIPTQELPMKDFSKKKQKKPKASES